MLELDADKRIQAEAALAHRWVDPRQALDTQVLSNQTLHCSYLEKYADPSDEPSSAMYDQSFEDMDLSVERWKGKRKRWHAFVANWDGN